MLSTPVLFLIFNRPDTTAITFAEISKQKPKYLYIAADGPRSTHPHDVALCETTRNIVSNIDWDCEVKTLYQDKNLGCGLAPATAITWFFNHVEEGIILEDDCVPNESFFQFCEDLLHKYRNENRVMMISGTSYQPQSLVTDTYYFSHYPHVWGWATWKRAWSNYNFRLNEENEADRASVINHTFSNNRERDMWKKNMMMIINGLDAWDYQWMYWIWKNNGVCIVPWKNMVANIGFGEHATHTFDCNSGQSKMKQHLIKSIKHPFKIEINKRADNYERRAILIGTARMHYYRKLRFIAGKILKPWFIKNAR